MKTYIFRVELEEEEDGRWSAVVAALPGCATWGYSREEAFKNIQEAAQAYVETLLEDDGRSFIVDRHNNRESLGDFYGRRGATPGA